jgi:hypothetical protein
MDKKEQYFILKGIICKIYNRFNYRILINEDDSKYKIYIDCSLGRNTKKMFRYINLYDKVDVKLSIFHPKQNVKIIKIYKNI